jgi:hypothetical protein
MSKINLRENNILIIVKLLRKYIKVITKKETPNRLCSFLEITHLSSHLSTNSWININSMFYKLGMCWRGFSGIVLFRISK